MVTMDAAMDAMGRVVNRNSAENKKPVPVRAKAKEIPSDAELIQELGYLPSWPESRKRLAKLFNHTAFDLGVSSVVMFNLYVVIAETDFHAKYPDEDSKQWLTLCNIGLLVFYSCEMFARLYAFGWTFWEVPTNVFDFVIVSIDLVSYPLTLLFGSMFSISFLRIFRLVRLTRSAKFAKLSPELSLLMRGLRDTGKTLIWGALMIFMVLTMWSIVAVEVIHPINLEIAERTSAYAGCERCSRAFESVMQSNLTFFQQLLAGDSWGQVTIPIIEWRPSTAIFFAFVHITVSVGLMNLLLAVIVDRANSARQDDIKTILKETEYQKKKLKAQLLETFNSMDLDSNGKVTEEELVEAFDSDPNFAMTMKAMAIEEDELHIVFDILDKDQDGEVDYDEFVEQLWKMKSQDSHTLLVFIKHHVTEVRHILEKEIMHGHDVIKEHMSRLFCGSQKLDNKSARSILRDSFNSINGADSYNGHGRVIAEMESLSETSPHKLNKMLFSSMSTPTPMSSMEPLEPIAIETTPRTNRSTKGQLPLCGYTPRIEKLALTPTPLPLVTPREVRESSSMAGGSNGTHREVRECSTTAGGSNDNYDLHSDSSSKGFSTFGGSEMNPS